MAEPPARRAAPWSDREGALVELVRARLGLVGPTTAAALAEPFGLSVSSVNSALGRVEADGGVLRGRFTLYRSTPDATEWCDRRLLARIHRRTLDRLRREIEPVSAADLMRFLFAWQHVKPGLQLHGRDGLGKIIEQLEGFEVAAAGWEREVLPARVARYEPAWLDELCLSGEVAWGRLERHESARHAGRRLSGTVPITLLRRQNLAWLLEPRDGADEEALSAPARDVLAQLRASGASFTDELAGRVRRLRIEVEEALCELVSAGLVTGDGFAGLRSLLHSEKRRRLRPGRQRPLRAPIGTGRWALLDAPAAAARRTTSWKPARASTCGATASSSAICSSASPARPPGGTSCASTAASRCAASCAAGASWPASSASSSPRPKRSTPSAPSAATPRAARSSASPPATRSTSPASSPPAPACPRCSASG